MQPYYEKTHILMEDHLQELLRHIEDCLTSDSTDITEVMLVVIKLLRGYKEQTETLSVLCDLHRFRLSRFEGSDTDIRFWTGFYFISELKLFWTHYVEPNTRCNPTHRQILHGDGQTETWQCE